MVARERILIDWKETKIKKNKQSYAMLQVLFAANVETRICCFYSVATWSVELENFMPVWPKVYNYVNSGYM